MAPGSKTPYNPSDNSAPFMVLPEHVYGFIDLKTLADIHRYLSESEADEDIVLANWVKENYLYEPIDQGGRTIRTTEGFSNLDRAYRRVRSLTNKAQDKWPFFDRNWKQMSSATVKNNARGEAAPGVSLPGMNNESRDSPVTNSFHTTEASPAPQLQVPFGTKQPSRYSVLGKHHPRSAQQTPIPLPPTPPPNSKKQIQPRGQSESVDYPTPSKHPEPQFELEDDAQPEVTPPPAMTQSKPTLHDGEYELVRAASADSYSKPLNTTAVSDQPKPSVGTEVEPLRDAGRGKVRGLNGRYLPKDKPVKALPKSKTATRGKSKRRTSANSETPLADVSPSPSTQDDRLENGFGTPDVPASIQDSDLGDGLNSPAVPTSISNNDDESGDRAASEPTSHAHLSLILAAEAEAVASNLDRLPPGLARRPNKRKSEPTSQQGERKRGRHGGIVGRPRKSEQKFVNPDADVGAEETMEDKIPQMITRRRTRRSAVSMSNEDAYAGHEEINALATSKAASVKTREPATSTTAEAHKNREDSQSGATSEPQKDSRDSQAGATAQLQHHPEDGQAVVTGSISPQTESPTDLRHSLDTASSAAAQLQEPREDSQAGESTLGPQVPQLSDAELLAIGISKTDPPAQKSDLRPAKMQQSTCNTPKDARPTHSPGHVEYFARVHTFTGTLDVSIAAGKVDDDEDALVRKYAEWMAQEGGVDITFKHFCSIFGFARRG